MENLDLTQILKDCPKGTKLFCVEYGYVKLSRICEDDPYPICIERKNGENEYFTKDGYCVTTQSRDEFSEPSLYPAHDQRDWSKFKASTKKVKVTLHPFDKVLVMSEDIGDYWEADILSEYVDEEGDSRYICIGGGFPTVIPYNKDTAYLVGTDLKCPIDYEIEFSKEFKED